MFGGRLLAVATVLVVCGCGGADRPPGPHSGTSIGPAGGTVNGPSGAQVVIPAGALSAPTLIAITQSSTGAPALPASIVPAGPIFEFTPHGTAFARPVTMTVPFDPGLAPPGAVLVIYKTNAQGVWEPVHGATQIGETVSAEVGGFSYGVVGPQPPDGFPELTEKSWRFETSDFNGDSALPFDADTQTGGALDRKHLVGADRAGLPPDEKDFKAPLEAFSNESGKTFWTQADSPRSLRGDPRPINTSKVELTQTYTFKLRNPTATLDFEISHARVEALDTGGVSPGLEACPWLAPTLPPQFIFDACAAFMMEAKVTVSFTARSVGSADDFFSRTGMLRITGSRDKFVYTPDPGGTEDEQEGNLFNFFEFDEQGFGILEFSILPDNPRLNLRTPKTVSIPLGSLLIGDEFNVTIDMSNYTRDLVAVESYAVAYLRDPVDIDQGLTIHFTGLEQLPVNHDPVPAQVSSACQSPDPTAGQFEFSAAEYSAPEKSEGADITIRRTGASHGEVKVMLETVDGTAKAGTDYSSEHRVLRFADGETSAKVVNIGLVQDKIEEPDETLTLKLTPFAGCATTGATSTATLTILDDDHPVIPPSNFTVGGTVSGLQGSGLVLRDTLAGETVTVASSGPFTFPIARADGTGYDVRVDAQPSNPLQACSVANGTGTVSGANVGNIAVTCTTPIPPGGLDPSFGDAGRAVTTVPYSPNLLRNRIGMALQSDGKILMVGGLKLLRLNTDGTPDGNFGTQGVVDIVFANGTLDTAMDVTVQADGKIVVAGTTSTTAVGSDNFALTRFDSRGALDTTFGTGGHVTTDFFGSTDQVRRMVLQADGKILVVGSAIHPVSPTSGSTLFAIARYDADGNPDPTFAVNGKTTDSPGQVLSFAGGVTIQSDGNIVVAGSTAPNGGDDPDTGVVRYLGDGHVKLPGTRDESFGPMSNGTLEAPVDQSVDVVTLSDGTILTAVQVTAALTGTGGIGFGLAHIPATGVPPPRLPQPVITFTSEGDFPKAMLKQTDGKIVVVGQSGGFSTNPDMAILRLDDTGFRPDPSFGTDGKQTVDFFGHIDSAEAVVQQADGKLVVGGFARSGAGNVFAAVRLAQ